MLYSSGRGLAPQSVPTSGADKSMAHATVKLLACLHMVVLQGAAIQIDVDTNEPISYQPTARPLRPLGPGLGPRASPSPTYSSSDASKSYSHTFVASPGVRKYNYGISHDPAGRDFSIHYNPLDTDVDMDNYLPEPWRPPSHYTPQYRTPQYSPQYDRVLLSVQAPSPAAMQKSSRGIQGVHTAYSNSLPVQPTASDVIIRSPKPMTFADFDLGLMGYGDFMESQDYDSGASPSPTPAVYSTASPIVHSTPRAPPIRFLPKVKFPQNTLKFPKSNNQIGLVQNLRVPKLQYGFKPIDATPVVPRQPSFTPSFDDDSRLQDLADKAFSKVFMSHNHARNPMVFSQTDHARFTDLGMLRQSQTPVSGRSMEKTVLVPVIYIPGQGRVPAHGILMSPYNSFNTKRD